MNTNAGAAKPASGELAGGMLASGPFSHTGRAEAAQRSIGSITDGKTPTRPHQMEAMNARTMRADRRKELREAAFFWIKIIAVCAATLAAMQIANKAIANVAHTVHENQSEASL